MAYLYIIITVSIIIPALMFFVFPLLVKLKPIDDIKYLNVDEESYLKLSDDLAKNFEFIKLVKNAEGKYEKMIVYPKDNIKSCDFTIAIKEELDVKIKGYKLKFIHGDEIEVDFKKPFSKIAIYLNRINAGVLQRHIIQKIDRLNVELFMAFEWLGMAGLVCLTIWDFVMHSALSYNFFGYWQSAVIIAVPIVFMTLAYLTLRYMTFWYLGQYIYGGKFDVRN